MILERIGLIAGNGKFPILFTQAAHLKGVEVIAVAIKEETSEELEKFADRIYWISVGEFRKLFEAFKNEGIKRVAMAGQIKHILLFKDIELDDELKSLLQKVKDKKTDTLLGAVANRFESLGIELVNSVEYLVDFLATHGTIAKREPTSEEWEDIRFGRTIAERIVSLDIGQTVVVKNKAILAIEAIEGTDEAIRRGGNLGKNGVVVVKLSKGKNQDMRFDVPVIGPRTIDVLIEIRGSCLAIESGKTLIIDRDECIEKADAAGIAIVGI